MLKEILKQDQVYCVFFFFYTWKKKDRKKNIFFLQNLLQQSKLMQQNKAFIFWCVQVTYEWKINYTWPKVLETFKISCDCHIKTSLSLKPMAILKITPSTVF